MFIYKLMAALAAMALGAAVILGLPSLSPDVEAGLTPSGVKADRLVNPEPVKPEQAQPEPVKLEQVQPAPPVKPEQARPEPVKPEPAQPQQAKAQPAKPEQGPSAKAKGCADTTLSYYQVKCQRTLTRVVNGVRTTRILAADPPSQE